MQIYRLFLNSFFKVLSIIMWIAQQPSQLLDQAVSFRLGMEHLTGRTPTAMVRWIWQFLDMEAVLVAMECFCLRQRVHNPPYTMHRFNSVRFVRVFGHLLRFVSLVQLNFFSLLLQTIHVFFVKVLTSTICPSDLVLLLNFLISKTMHVKIAMELLQKMVHLVLQIRCQRFPPILVPSLVVPLVLFVVSF